MGIGENTRQIIMGRLAQSTSLSEIDYCLELWVQTHSFRQVHFLGLTSQLAFNRRAFFIHSHDISFKEKLNSYLNDEVVIALRQCLILEKKRIEPDIFSDLHAHLIPAYGSHQAVGLFFVQPIEYKPIEQDERMFISHELHLFTQPLFKAYLPRFEQDISLTRREVEVLSWVAQGKSNTVIAEIMGVSPHTIDNYLRRTYAKIGVNNRTSAAVKALLLGLTAI